MRYVKLILFILLIACGLQGQNILIHDQAGNISTYAEINTAEKHRDSLIANNHLEFSIDSIWSDTSGQHWLVHIGEPYTVTVHTASDSLLFNRYEDYLYHRDTSLSSAMDKGYAYAKWKNDSTYITDNHLYLVQDIVLGELITIDSIQYSGNLEINSTIANRLLNISPNTRYSTRYINSILDQVDRITFAQIDTTPYIIRDQYLNRILLIPLDKKRVNQFDFLIGIIPRNTQTDSPLFITYNLESQLHNILGQAEILEFQLRQFQAQQPLFHFSLDFPYLLNLPYGAYGGLKSFRNRFEFQNLELQGGLNYTMPEYTLKLGYTYNRSRLIDLDTVHIQSEDVVDQLDYDTQAFTLGLSKRRSSNATKIHKFQLAINLAVGTRRLIENQDIIALRDGENLSNPFDLESKSISYQLEAIVAHNLGLSKYNVLYTALSSAYRFNRNGVLENERYRIGGSELLRGFDEASIITDSYAVLSLEHRLQLGPKSYIGLPILDIAVIENNKWLTGIGTSLQLETKGGLFTFALAAGAQDNIRFDFGRTRVHLKYSSEF